ncbi:MAG: hypothetical protein DCC59_05070 [Chloroflexi bacterium]|nr:hypothetical protein [Chloroflexi bacterium CFX1]MCK6568577.1 hypothetical protein [Anaerolineales bacterium]MCQ3953939.1 hypothetical protein [Chloroflexota bacterium]MDL1920405.1 hypothetical protein [Chloroflexi bacterium CFX5]NUQ58949.1 hypothetical protein [Anaerolineales bacterium]
MTDIIIAGIGQTEVGEHWVASLRYSKIIVAFLILTTAMLAGCTAPAPVTPTARVLADSAFSASAYLDANFNGELDAKDTPLEGATFYVALDGVKAFAATTDKDGYAFILIPSSMDYPVMLGMDPPKDSGLKVIGPSEVAYNISDEFPKFLFSSK